LIAVEDIDLDLIGKTVLISSLLVPFGSISCGRVVFFWSDLFSLEVSVDSSFSTGIGFLSLEISLFSFSDEFSSFTPFLCSSGSTSPLYIHLI
jgi:hypothetical protein